MYAAKIYYEAYQDVYGDGQSFACDNAWTEELLADTPSELRNKVLEATYSKWQDIDDEQMNEYDWCTEYHTSYLANADNQGEATPSEIEAWKQGKLKLWAINCHILVTEVTEKKASLN